MNLYTRKTIEFISIIIILIGSILFTVQSLIQINVLSYLPRWLHITIGIIFSISIAIMVFKRDYYLPFLGDTVFPCEPLVEKKPDGATISTTIHVTPNSNVVFWASEHADKTADSIQDYIAEHPISAYSEYSNSGIVRSNAQGVATLSVRPPISYKIPSGRVLKPHIHYRVCGKGGILGAVQTVYI